MKVSCVAPEMKSKPKHFTKIHQNHQNDKKSTNVDSGQNSINMYLLWTIKYIGYDL